MLRGVSVTVVRRTLAGRDGQGRPAYEEVRQVVDDVLTSPASSSGESTQDSAPERRGGSLTRRRFDFPKTFSGSLAGCSIEYGGRSWRVVGDPEPYLDHLTPGPFNRPVEAVDEGGA